MRAAPIEHFQADVVFDGHELHAVARLIVPILLRAGEHEQQDSIMDTVPFFRQ